MCVLDLKVVGPILLMYFPLFLDPHIAIPASNYIYLLKTKKQRTPFNRVSCQVDYPTKLSKMQNVSDITIFVPQNFGADSTIITYLGFKGEDTKVRNKRGKPARVEGLGGC